MADQGHDFIVIRRGDDLEPDEMPDDLDGRWIDNGPMRRRLPGNAHPIMLGLGGGLVASPAGRFEVRDSDGAVAEVWEARRMP